MGNFILSEWSKEPQPELLQTSETCEARDCGSYDKYRGTCWYFELNSTCYQSSSESELSSLLALYQLGDLALSIFGMSVDYSNVQTYSGYCTDKTAVVTAVLKDVSYNYTQDKYI